MENGNWQILINSKKSIDKALSIRLAKRLGSFGDFAPNEWSLRDSKKGICHFPFYCAEDPVRAVLIDAVKIRHSC